MDNKALMEILTKPKNALVKQFKTLLDMDGVELRFTDEALQEISKQAMDRKTGARGLRSILEKVMLDIMYDVPSDPSIKEIVITEEVITNAKQPMVVHQKEALAG
mgnify:CR=1 FL=1